jgi:hypothetical protein
MNVLKYPNDFTSLKVKSPEMKSALHLDGGSRKMFWPTNVRHSFVIFTH